MKTKAKSPAFLFYTGDFTTGTQFFSDEQIGKYLRLLMAQHQHGHLTENQMNFIMKSYDNEVMEKFVKDADGKFYNERLEFEINKRENFVSSRSKNKLGKLKSNIKTIKKDKKIISKSYDNHMDNDNEIENLIEIEKRKPGFIKPEINEVCNYFAELNFLGIDKEEGNKFFDYYSSNGWKVGKNSMKDWKAAIRNWIKNTNQFNKNNGKLENGVKAMSAEDIKESGGFGTLI